MADGHRQRIGSVQGQGGFAQAKEQADHPAHLLLLGGPASRHGLLHEAGRVFEDRHPRLQQGKKGRSPDVAELQRHPAVASVENVLNRRALRGHLADQGLDGGGDVWQAKQERQIGWRRDGPLGECTEAAGAAFDHAVAGRSRAGINPEDQHGQDAARCSVISASSMSTFAQTFWTSSCSSRASIIDSSCWAFLPSILTVFFGTMEISAVVAGIPYPDSASLTACNRSGGDRTSQFSPS